MTIKRSDDEGMSWPLEKQLLYDERVCFGYSCLAPVDDRHIGVLYEGSGNLFFLRIPIEQISR
jgi:sialidase-1